MPTNFTDSRLPARRPARALPAHRLPSRQEHAFARRLREAWHPSGLDAPRVDPDLCSLGALERITECLRYAALNLEYFLSPSGALRAWCALTALFALYLWIPVFLVLPVVEWTLSSFDAGSAHLLAGIRHLSLSIQEVIKLALLATLGLAGVKALVWLAKSGLLGALLLGGALLGGWWWQGF